MEICDSFVLQVVQDSYRSKSHLCYSRCTWSHHTASEYVSVSYISIYPSFLLLCHCHDCCNVFSNVLAVAFAFEHNCCSVIWDARAHTCVYLDPFRSPFHALILSYLKIYTTLGYIFSLILLNLGHVFRFSIVSPMYQLEEEGSPRQIVINVIN